MNKNMLIKTLTALVLVAIVIPPFYFGGILLKLLELAVIFIASYEISSLCDQKPHWGMTVLMTVFITSMIRLLLCRNWTISSSFVCISFSKRKLFY